MAKWVAKQLRRIADRLDWDGAPKMTNISFTFESGKGYVTNWDDRGCPLWYMGTEDYKRAHDEASTVWG